MSFRTKTRRAGWLLVVAAFAFGLISVVKPQPAGAYGLISTRYVKMSSSANGATNTIYSVGFTTATPTQSVAAIAIHFCSNNPIIGDTCMTLSNGTSGTAWGFNTNYSTLSVQNWNAGGVGQFTIDTTRSNANTVVLTKAPSATLNATQAFSFDLGNGSTNGITNPTTTNTTFFARITVFASATGVDFSTDANAQTTEKSNNVTDAGGAALSTAAVLNVTAKVQEALTFCLYTGANCAAGGFDIKLGDSNNVLAATNQVYLDSTPKFDLASNALGGVIVRMKGDTLTSGAFTISPFGAGAGPTYPCVADSTATSSEQFGVRVVTYGAGQYNGSATTTTSTGGQDDFSCLAGNHKFDPTFTNTTYGQNFVRTLGATDVSSTNFELAAKAANTTEAGVYTTKLTFIATATY